MKMEKPHTLIRDTDQCLHYLSYLVDGSRSLNIDMHKESTHKLRRFTILQTLTLSALMVDKLQKSRPNIT